MYPVYDFMIIIIMFLTFVFVITSRRSYTVWYQNKSRIDETSLATQ